MPVSRTQCVYRMFNAAGELLYVGASGTFGARLDNHGSKTPWFSEVASITVEHHRTRHGAITAETQAIINERPRYNKTYQFRSRDRRLALNSDEAAA